MTQTTVALNSQWLDSSVPLSANFSNASPTVASCTNAQANCTTTTLAYPAYPQYQPGIWWYPYEGPSRPIRLTLSEIARLKAAAKRDAKLKAILAKFTDQIEITVDFE